LAAAGTSIVVGDGTATPDYLRAVEVMFAIQWPSSHLGRLKLELAHAKPPFLPATADPFQDSVRVHDRKIPDNYESLQPKQK